MAIENAGDAIKELWLWRKGRIDDHTVRQRSGAKLALLWLTNGSSKRYLIIVRALAGWAKGEDVYDGQLS
ncbi:hypothetical protein T12_4921 [Trichinella patagoniensis]|uniref:Uncharacterized protein n=1 Tax=Trichinella patagoniensis TaxID=990121 RepID=A0A0V0ZT35_9BILA|nr:hypothetical protein T12_4921 [Trichinella patagoniensis]